MEDALRHWTSKFPHAVVALLVLVGTLVPLGAEVSAAESITQTFNYTGAVQTFTVPEGVSTLSVTLNGGQGGRGGGDSQGVPTPGGYRGVVTGTIEVTPGQEITVAVGGGGGTGTSSQGNAPGGSAGQNPLDGYDGAVGGRAGPAGSSGGGGGSGAATVLRIDGTDVVAAGAGGNGGNGQFLPIVGRRAEETHTARPDATSTTGRPGLNTVDACSPGFNCDGGASGAGGAGVQGGERGDVQYGGASATEYFGFGGFPGANGTGGHEGLSTLYEYYAGNSANGSVTISYDNGTPGAPRSLSGTPASGEVELEWLAPSSEGAASITDYVVSYSTSENGTYSVFDDGVSDQTGATVTGLTNGTTYWFKVAAVNSIGTGPTSATMAAGVVPSDVPDRPTIDAVAPVDAGLLVDLTPGDSDSPILSYDYRLDGGTWRSASEEDGRVTIGGLVNGRSYDVELRARNAVGASEASEPASGTPRAVPSAPSSLELVASDRAVSLTWQAPGSDNGAEITDYVIRYSTSADGPFGTFVDGDGTATSATVDGLSNGTTYYFQVAAVNAAGTGPSTPVATSTPFTTPDAPVIASLEGADGSLVVDLGPSSDGGSPLTGYQYRLDSGPWQSTGSTVEPFTIGGLLNGTTYQLEVRAQNGAGLSPTSEPASGAPRSVPAAPAISAVALDTGAVSVSFTLGSDGGRPITNVEYSIDGGDSWVTRSPASTESPVAIGGLVGGQTYDVRLRAVNDQGAGAPSNQSTVTAKGTPDAPTIGSMVAGDRTLSVTLTAGPNGGSAITNYEYSVDDGETWSTRSPASTASPLLLSGLSNGTAYAVRVRAVNAAGSGTASASSVGTPRTTPSAPTIDSDTIVGVGGELEVAFSAPASNGGSPVTGYQYSTDAGATWRDRATGTTGSPLLITTLSSDGTTPLEGGETYPVELRAVNAAGPGAASAVADGITTTAPAAPVIDTVEVSDSSAQVSFETPSNGGSTITRYEYRLDGGAWTETGSLSDVVLLAGLDNAGTYRIEVRAVNAVGAGPASAPRDFSVRTAPGAPDILSVTAGDRSLPISFVPGDDGGDPIQGYEFSTDGGQTWRDAPAGTSSPLTISTISASGQPLVNGTLYSVQLRAVNGVGAGAASVSTLVAPQGRPDAPGALTLLPGDGRLVVDFTIGSDGGSALTRIEYRLDGGAWIDSGSLSAPFTIAALTNGTTYQVEVRAVSALGAGDPSTVANGTPSTVASPPRGVSATVGDGLTTVSWTAPSNDGGVPISGYVVTLYDRLSDGLPVASCESETTTCDVGDLENGTTYYVGVVALNERGPSGANAPRVAVTPLGVPDVQIAAVNPGASELLVDVDTDANGSPVSTFEYRLDGGEWVSTSSSSEPFTISGLTTGTTYELEVRARNSVGVGPASAPVSATPRTVPGVPRSLVATSADGAVQLTWSSPISDGGSALTDYIVQYATSSGGSFTTVEDGTSADSGATVSGLTNGTAYVFRVAAVNAAGTGSWTALAGATPLAAPSAPNLSALSVGSQFLQAAFSAPSSNGGSPITGYEYRLNAGEWRSATGSTSPITIPGLTNGQSYTVELRAANAVGGGTSSNARTATPYGLPGAVPGFLASPGPSSVTLDWDAANANGSPITAYNVIRWSARTEGSIVASYQTTETTRTITGLGAGTYWFTIEATNAAGTGQRSAPRTSARVGGTVPAAPSVDSLVVDGDLASLEWTPGAAGTSAVSGYVVQYRATGDWVTVQNSSTVATSTSVQLPSVDQPYSLRLALRSETGIGTFTTLAPPITGPAAASEVGRSSATVGGAVNANGLTTSVDVEFAADPDDLGGPGATIVATDPGAAEGTDPTAVAAELSGLEPGTSYHARIRAVSDDGTALGTTTTFTTAAAITTSGLDVVYDGEPVDLDTVTEPEGLSIERTFEGIEGTSYATSSTPPTGAGTYRVRTEIVDDDLDGSEVTTLIVRPRELSAEITAVDRDYDGTNDVELTAELDGVLDGDEVQLAPLSGSLTGPDAGAARAVSISAPDDALVGEHAANYSVDLPTGTTVTIRRISQQLEFVTTAPSSFTVGSVYTPEARSDRSLVATIELLADGDASAACTLDDGVLRAVAPGSCVLVARQAGNTNVLPATLVAQYLTVVADATAPPTTAPPTTTPPASTPPTSAPAPTQDGSGAGEGSGLVPVGGTSPDGGESPLSRIAPDFSAAGGRTDAGSDDVGDTAGEAADASDPTAQRTAEGADGSSGDSSSSSEGAGSETAAGSDAAAVGLGDEVAGISESRGLLGDAVHLASRPPALALIALLAAAVVWLLAVRRRRDDDGS